MAILISKEIMEHLKAELSRSRDSLLFLSAYCKLPFIQLCDQWIHNPAVSKTLVVRFRPEDLLSGASDLELYPYCRSHGWKLYFRLDLHAKTYVFDGMRCVIGSANATARGMSLGGSGNYEIAAAYDLSPRDALRINDLLYGAALMTEEIYLQMKEHLSGATRPQHRWGEWPAEITKHLVPDCSLLFSEDFPPCASPIHATVDDMAFLQISADQLQDMDAVRQAFQRSKCYRWLVHLLLSQEEHQLYYGAVTAALHNALLDEPKPYRKDGKRLLSNLLSWIEVLSITEISIDIPKHSQRIKLTAPRNG